MSLLCHRYEFHSEEQTLLLREVPNIASYSPCNVIATMNLSYVSLGSFIRAELDEA